MKRFRWGWIDHLSEQSEDHPNHHYRHRHCLKLQRRLCRLKRSKMSWTFRINICGQLTCAILNNSRETNSARCVCDNVDIDESQKLRWGLGWRESTPTRCNSSFAYKIVRHVDGTGQIDDLHESVENDWRWQADDGNVVGEIAGRVVLVEGQTAQWDGSALLVWLFAIHEMSSDDSFKATDDVNLSKGATQWSLRRKLYENRHLHSEQLWQLSSSTPTIPRRVQCCCYSRWKVEVQPDMETDWALLLVHRWFFHFACDWAWTAMDQNHGVSTIRGTRKSDAPQPELMRKEEHKSQSIS